MSVYPRPCSIFAHKCARRIHAAVFYLSRTVVDMKNEFIGDV